MKAWPVAEHIKGRESIKEFQTWVTYLKSDSDLCLSEILDTIESPSGTPDSRTATQASGAIDRIAERIVDVMSAYDALLGSLDLPPHFAAAINHLNELDGNAE